MATQTFEARIEAATASRQIPGVLLLAASADGKFNYQKAFGPATPTSPLTLDSTFVFASCTKLITSIAALQVVEKGLIGLDDDVSIVLTELKDVEILKAFDDEGKPVLEKAKNKVTLRHLLSHSSGFGYDLMNPLLTQWRESRGEEAGVKGMPLLARINIPLTFEPGTSWQYGQSSDWAGVLVSRLSGLSLDAYFKKYIFEPLGLQNLTFHRETNDKLEKNLVKMTARGGIPGPIFTLPVKNEEPVVWFDEDIYENPTVDEYGGVGLVGSAAEYFKVLESLLKDDGKLLKSATLDEMFKGQLTQGGREAYQAHAGLEFYKDGFASHKKDIRVDYALGGMVILDDEETGRKTGTLSWSGLPNLLWTVDRETGLALLYASNVVPFGDFTSGEHQRAFEKEMYTRYEEVLKEGGNKI